ncbi:maspardin [Tribolium castaneum]|uniref:Maspardin-like Protein n=1 Tax=Tribolium castaneum TaxID=7070 RepID=D6WQD6_TRICA|nr:PREDICTED: maspardin [Tribolium castaneum]EFA06956.1 Maspardin-like Protein [Tribolium castaneum]|eukprot:XP_973570.1 PREDICTED: maspardin [Tribolium castaneum]
MSYISDLSQSQEYLSFRSSVPLKRVVVDTDNTKGWRIYDCGPKKVKCPLICLPPVSGTADIFFKQALALSAKGIRVISAEAPVYWNVKEWCEGFRKLLDYLEVVKVHIFGASLGGYLAQKFAEYTVKCPRVASLILCNTFTDTAIFNNHESAAIFWMLPGLVLKRMIMSNFGSAKVDPEMVEAIDFMVERLESLPQTELASRLTLNCLKGYVEAHKLADLPITVIDVFDEYALSNAVREELYKCYPNAKLAHLKTGGNFPYLSRCSEVNLHLQIHLRQFDDSDLSSSDRPLINRC